MRFPIILLAALAAVSLLAAADSAPTEGVYRLPPEPLLRAVDRYNSNEVDLIHSALSPDRSTLLIQRKPPLSSLAEKSEPHFVRGDFTLYLESWRTADVPLFTGLSLVRIADGHEITVQLPSGARVGATAWSPDSRRLACLVYEGRRPGRPWIIYAATGETSALASVAISAVGPRALEWLGSDRLLARAIPSDLGPKPSAEALPSGPIEAESAPGRGGQMAGIFAQSLFASAFKERLYAHYATVQLKTLTLDGGAAPFGVRGVVRPQVSPDGRFVLLTTAIAPHLAPDLEFLRFVPRRTDVYAASGVFVRCVNERFAVTAGTLAGGGTGATSPGRRAIHWRRDQPATLAWFEALDGGDPDAPAQWRDQLCQWEAPFAAPPLTLFKSKYRLSEVRWENADVAELREAWPSGGIRERGVRFNPSRPEDRPAPVNRTPEGAIVGPQASGEKERFIAFLDKEKTRVLLTRQSPEEPPNCFVRDLRSEKTRQITWFQRAPLIERGALRTEEILVRRSDGVPIRAAVFLPAAWRAEEGPLPALFVAYPFSSYRMSQEAHAPPTSSPARPEYEVAPLDPMGYREFALLGYAVLAVRYLPVVGDGTRPPEDFLVPQIVEGATLVIEEAVRRGFVDSRRVAVGGHSYGGMMAANLLAHSRLFRAGFASAGVHDFTQLPFGAQNETRALWQARDTYVGNSPFFHADLIQAPLLLIHGERDARVPVKFSRDLYNAVSNLGGTARLVILPFEPHSPNTRESVLHIEAEIAAWLERHLK